ncbi:nucleotidyltransferase domain-containing protein [Streptomyces sp. NPDC101178]|uniref:nucleotidyltransferase domain-containing protein n=1 Tax=Streptomyces sp. NPDC101178 TaxID=3366124 RepID=UPI003808B5E6
MNGHGCSKPRRTPESLSAERLADEERRLIAERYPQAVGALLGGSAARGRVTAGSDLDVAVLLPDGEAGGREVIREVLAAGPPALSSAAWERGRYLLTCFLDDLTDASSASRYEQLALADAVPWAEQADSVRLLEAGAEVLGLCGGPLREGYVQHWGPSA